MEMTTGDLIEHLLGLPRDLPVYFTGKGFVTAKDGWYQFAAMAKDFSVAVDEAGRRYISISADDAYLRN